MFEPESIFFTSDHHFSHKLMLKLRNFNILKEHDEFLIDRWNSKIPLKKAVVFHLGDFSLGSLGYTFSLLEKLNGNICLIKGNHDKLNSVLKKKFIWVKDVYDLKVKDKDPRFPWCKGTFRVFLSHYAHRTWPASHHGSLHLYGHSHSKLPDDSKSLSFDVGVDCHDCFPLSWNEVKDIMSKKQSRIQEKYRLKNEQRNRL